MKKFIAIVLSCIVLGNSYVQAVKLKIEEETIEEEEEKTTTLSTDIGEYDQQGSRYDEEKEKREKIEDRHTVIDLQKRLEDGNDLFKEKKAIYCGVFDGHNGPKAANFASKYLHLIIVHNLVNKTKDSDDLEDKSFMEKIFTDSFETFDKIMGPQFNDGTTAVVSLLLGDTLWIAHVGDSRAIVCTDTEVTYATKDHDCRNKSEKERVEKDGGTIDEKGRLKGTKFAMIDDEWEYTSQPGVAVSRALGDYCQYSGEAYNPEQYLNRNHWTKLKALSAVPAVAKIELKPEDKFLILMSDGITSKMDNDEILEFVAEQCINKKTPSEAAQELVEKAADLGARDDLTAIVVKFNWN